MKYLESETFLGDNECSEDAIPSSKLLQIRLDEKDEQLAALPADASLESRLTLILERGYLQLDLDQNEAAWKAVQEMLPQAIDNELWLQAVEACDILYQAEQA
ncbi:hypothetical protein QQ73_05940, partial [Candidatus Endoriftia persephone str. Guaymas]|nr:hypothetical protein [Candidatus Endoriftia persephone str. Guaymas]